jgi:Sulfotransferase family
MKRPVFVVGCPRSGTTLLYSMLVAAGGFAFYRKETYFYHLVRRFPELSTTAGRERFMQQFLHGYLGKVPGLNVEPLVRQSIAQCRTPEDFLPRLMSAIAREQGMERWIEGTPAHVLYLREIKRAVPDALFLHVIRDGRDCALSNERQGWVPMLPWDRSPRLAVAALYWQWMVRAGRSYGRAHPDDYLELRFESLIVDPRATLRRVGAFIDHDLDYDRIQQNPVHALYEPNTSFRNELGQSTFNPLRRWMERCSPEDIRLCELLVGNSLQDLGYPLVSGSTTHPERLRARYLRALYSGYFSAKHSLRARTPLGRYLTRTSVWSEQPRPDERPVRAIHAGPAAAGVQQAPELVGR